MSPMQTDTLDALPLSVQISPKMRNAAEMVAKSYDAFCHTCYRLPEDKKRQTIPQNLRHQQELKRIYHLSLGFLQQATLAANPLLQPAIHPELTAEQADQWKHLIYPVIDKRLNTLVAECKGSASYTDDTHPVMFGPH